MKILWIDFVENILKLGLVDSEESIKLGQIKYMLYSELEISRGLSDEIIKNIDELLKNNLKQIEGIVVNQGPASFTTLRIIMSVVNAMAKELAVPIIGFEESERDELGILSRIVGGEDQEMILPFYGQEPNITKPESRKIKRLLN